MLDANQREAVYLPVSQSVIVEAPPGHGKTFVMAKRINHLIRTGQIKAPKKILGLTFTNAAASEMLDDIKTHVDAKDLDVLRILTFHSIAYKILLAYGNLIGIEKSFQIIGEVEQKELIESVKQHLSLDLDENDYRKWTTEALLKQQKNCDYPFADNAKAVYEAYLTKLEGKLDYTSLLVKAIELLEESPAVLTMYRSIFRYILVDEFQDTNSLQYRFLSLLALGYESSHQNVKIEQIPVFILADEDQAIFRFQGATPDNIQRAQSDFRCQKITLEVNYRCKSTGINILTKAMRGGKVTPVPSNRPQLTISLNPVEEAELILSRTKVCTRLEDIGIIAQNQYRLSQIRDALQGNDIPYVFIPDFSAGAIEKKHERIFTAISDLHKDKNFEGRITTKLQEIYTVTGANQDDEVLQALLNLARNFDVSKRSMPFAERALNFYNDVFIQLNWGSILRKTVHDKVFLSTIHGVKGLQFSDVHILGLSNFEHINKKTCWPCNCGQNHGNFHPDLKDAHKLLYVGTTRAISNLYLYSTKRSYKDTSRNVVCVLAPYKGCLDINGDANFCGGLWVNARCSDP